MNKNGFSYLVKGSAAYVVAHGKWKNSRGRRFSMSFGIITNPKLAHVAAEKVLYFCATYQVPKEKINYNGDFILELTSKANTNLALEAGAQVFYQEAYVSGRVVQSLGGIQLYNKNSPFYYGYVFLRAIRKSDGTYLWKNYDYENMR